MAQVSITKKVVSVELKMSEMEFIALETFLNKTSSETWKEALDGDENFLEALHVIWSKLETARYE